MSASNPPRERISAAIAAPRCGRAGAVVAFLTAGYPSAKLFREHLAALAAEADVVEIGVPFTDPMADGVTIQRSSQAALQQGVTLRWILDTLRGDAAPRGAAAAHELPQPAAGYGYARLACRCGRGGVCGFIVPDLPIDESEELRAGPRSQGWRWCRWSRRSRRRRGSSSCARRARVSSTQ
jgi:tryptophan synthase alpha chain